MCACVKCVCICVPYVYASTMVVLNGPLRLLKKGLIIHLSTYKLFINLQVQLKYKVEWPMVEAGYTPWLW